MVKEIVRFRKDCLELLNLMVVKAPNVKFNSLKHDRGYEPRGILCKKNFSKIIILLTYRLLDMPLGSKNQRIGENYTRKYLDSQISKFLLTLRIKSPKKEWPEKLDAYFNILKRKLRKDIRSFSVVHYIVNLKFDSSILIGKVSFLPYTKQNIKNIFIKEWADPKKNIPPSYLGETSKQQKGILMAIGGIAKVTIEAGETEKAQEKARVLTEEGLGLLEVFSKHGHFGILGFTAPPMLYMAESFDKKEESVAQLSEWKYLLLNLPIFKRKEFQNKAREPFENVNGILRKDIHTQTVMENKLIVAIRWFREIQKHKNDPENVIRLIIALESLFSKPNKREKFEIIAKRLVLINHKDEENKDFIFKVVKELYKSRNRFVHDGKSNFRILEFNTINNELRSGIINIAKEIDKKPNFEDWFKNELSFFQKIIIYLKKISWG